jgi:hypothetical protein
MKFLSILKRVVPFAITLGIGLFIASFFVSIQAPVFEFKKNRSWSQHHDCHKSKRTNREMRKEILDLKMELEAARSEVERLVHGEIFTHRGGERNVGEEGSRKAAESAEREKFGALRVCWVSL